jgi:hypothetical protein
MGSSQTARRVTHDRGRRPPVIRPDSLRLYKVKVGPDSKPPETTALVPAMPPARSSARRAFLIALIVAVGVNFGAILGLVGWGVLQALGVFDEPAIEKVQRAQSASIAQIEASVEALNASITGLSAHFNAAGEREDAANRRVAEIGDAVGVLRAGMTELRAAQAAASAAAEEPWRKPVEDVTASVAKLRGDMSGLRASIDDAKPRVPANLGARLDRIEQALAQHKLLGPIRGTIEPERTAAAVPATDGHIISLPVTQ